jgi:hypothetical protein
MNKLIFKTKGILGFCQCKKCWNRAVATMTIKQIGKSIDICEEHMNMSLEGAELTGITFEE